MHLAVQNQDLIDDNDFSGSESDISGSDNDGQTPE